MKEKYFETLCIIGEILIDVKSELNWKDTQLTMKSEEIASLKDKIKEIEQFLDKEQKK